MSSTKKPQTPLRTPLNLTSKRTPTTSSSLASDGLPLTPFSTRGLSSAFTTPLSQYDKPTRSGADVSSNWRARTRGQDSSSDSQLERGESEAIWAYLSDRSSPFVVQHLFFVHLPFFPTIAVFLERRTCQHLSRTRILLEQSPSLSCLFWAIARLLQLSFHRPLARHSHPIAPRMPRNPSHASSTLPLLKRSLSYLTTMKTVTLFPPLKTLRTTATSSSAWTTFREQRLLPLPLLSPSQQTPRRALLFPRRMLLAQVVARVYRPYLILSLAYTRSVINASRVFSTSLERKDFNALPAIPPLQTSADSPWTMSSKHALIPGHNDCDLRMSSLLPLLLTLCWFPL